MQTTYFGSSLEEAINTVSPEREALIENFLYEKSALMLYADDGVGKSVLTLQACLQATVAESKVFGEFNVPKARKVLYFQMERHPDESFERMRHLQNVLPFDKEIFALSVALQGTNLQDKKDKAEAIGKISDIVTEIGFDPDIIAFDPIYTMASSGLETADACNAITSFFRVIQLLHNCTILATSHTNRGVRDPEQKGKRVGQDMYGNRFLSAFFTSSYHIIPKGDGIGSIWKRDKNSLKNLEKQFELSYDGSNYCSWMSADTKLTKKDKLEMFLKAQKNSGKEFDFDQMIEVSGLSSSGLRVHLTGQLQEKLEIVSKSKRGKILYRSI